MAGGLESGARNLQMLSLVLPDVLCCLAVDGPAAQCLTTVVDRLALGQSDFTLDEVIFGVEAERNQCQALLLDAAHEFIYLLPVQQQPPVAERVGVHITTGSVSSDVA